MIDSLKNISYRLFYVWKRNSDVFVRTWFVSIIPPLLEPIFFYLAFGLGMGSMMGNVTYSGTQFIYRLYLAPAIAAIAIMNYAFFECSYSSFVKMEYQKTYEAITATPLSLEDIIAGEIVWGATRAVGACLVIVAILQFFAPFHWEWLWLVILSSFLGGLFFSCFGLIFTGILPTIEMFNYPVFLIITPMMLLSGTFFPVENFGNAMAFISELFPLTHVTRLVRNAYLGIFTNKEWFSLIYLLVTIPVTALISIHFVRKRIIH
jgi:lipooligosaccharide transport system permease protein